MKLLICRYAMISVLLLIAIHQRYQVVIHNLSPWKGGGFAMYTREPVKYTCLLNIFIKENGQFTKVFYPKEVRQAYKKALYLPNKTEIERLAQSLFKLKWAKIYKGNKIEYDYMTAYKEENAKELGHTIEYIEKPSFRIQYSKINTEPRTGKISISLVSNFDYKM